MRGSATRTAITHMAPPFKTQGTLGLLLRYLPQSKAPSMGQSMPCGGKKCEIKEVSSQTLFGDEPYTYMGQARVFIKGEMAVSPASLSTPPPKCGRKT